MCLHFAYPRNARHRVHIRINTHYYATFSLLRCSYVVVSFVYLLNKSNIIILSLLVYYIKGRSWKFSLNFEHRIPYLFNLIWSENVLAALHCDKNCQFENIVNRDAWPKLTKYCSHICKGATFGYNKQAIPVITHARQMCGTSSKSIKQFCEQHRNYEHMHFLEYFHAEALRARSISSNDRPFVSTTLPAMYKTARTQTAENPKYTELIPNLFTTLKK